MESPNNKQRPGRPGSDNRQSGGRDSGGRDSGGREGGKGTGSRRNFPLLLLVLGLLTAVVFMMNQPQGKVRKSNVAEIDELLLGKDRIIPPGATQIPVGEYPWSEPGPYVPIPTRQIIKKIKIIDGKRVEGEFRTNIDYWKDTYPDHERFVIAFTGTKESNLLTQLRLETWQRSALAQNAEFEQGESQGGFLAGFVAFLPWLLLMIFFWWLIARQVRSAGGAGVMQFGRSKAKMHSQEVTGVTFEDVAGIEEAKDEVGEIVAFLKNPQKFKRIGARIPRGVLLVGPPGCGKTLLAKAISGEAGVPFFSVSGSDFVEMFVGVGASRVRDLFKQARESAPCIIFLDEIDAVGRRRGTGLGGGHDEREQTLNQILVEMDGFDSDTGIILLAATNRPDVLDPALLRPGRFDRNIVINLPDVNGRESILRVHSRKVKMAAGVDLHRVARATPGFSGAELEALVNEGALMAVTAGREQVTLHDLEEARDKIRFGKSRSSMAMTENEKRLTAYHEAGHAILTVLQEKADPLHKVTIIPRGMALGVTMSLPEKDRVGMSEKEMLARLRIMYGGRIAEDLIFSDVTSGAQNDIEQATELARLMVTKWGMSEKVGPISYAEGEEHLFLGREVTRTVNHSEHTARTIDEEVKRLLEEAYVDAEKMIREHLDNLHKIAEALLVYETVSGEEVTAIMQGTPVAQIRPAAPATPSTPAPATDATSEAGQPASEPTDPRPEGGPQEGYAF